MQNKQLKKKQYKTHYTNKTIPQNTRLKTHYKRTHTNKHNTETHTQ